MVKRNKAINSAGVRQTFLRETIGEHLPELFAYRILTAWVALSSVRGRRTKSNIEHQSGGGDIVMTNGITIILRTRDTCSQPVTDAALGPPPRRPRKLFHRVRLVERRRGSQSAVHDSDRPFFILVGDHLFQSGERECQSVLGLKLRFVDLRVKRFRHTIYLAQGFCPNYLCTRPCK